MELKNISGHRPKDMIIDIAEEDAKSIIKTGEFKESVKENLIISKEDDEEEEFEDDVDEKKLEKKK